MLKADILRKIPLFAALSDHDLHLIYKLASEQTYRRGDVVFFENDQGDALHVVLNGTVRIYRLAEDGREKTLAYLGAGEFFGEMAVLDGGARSAVAEALERTRTLAIYRPAFTNLLEQHPHLSLEVIRVLSNRLRHTNAQLTDAVFRDARGRVTSCLYDLATTHGSPAAGGTRISLKLTHQELANLAGTARETVSRILAELQDAGLVQVDKHRLILVNMEQLRRLAE